MTGRFLTIVGFLLLTLAWYGFARSVDPYDDPGPLIHAVWIAMLIFAAVFALLAIIALFTRDGLWTWRFLTLLALILVPPFAAMGLSELASAIEDRSQLRAMEAVASELEAYRDAQGSYPETLHQLGAQPPAVGEPISFPQGVHAVKYSGRGQRFALYFETTTSSWYYLTHDGWVDEEPDFMYPLSSWAYGSDH